MQDNGVHWGGSCSAQSHVPVTCSRWEEGERGTAQVRLHTFFHGQVGWGHVLGRQVYERLGALVEAHPEALIFTISLEGIEHTDITFARESVIELARSYRRHRGFCLTDVHDQDVLECWDAAAAERQQPIFVWNEGRRLRCLGPQPGVGLREMLAYVLSAPVARTSEAAAAMHLKVPNASNKLKQLWQLGYILRRKESAGSGGVEYAYIRIA